MEKKEKHGFTLALHIREVFFHRLHGPGQALGQLEGEGGTPILILVQGRSIAQNLRTGSSQP